MNLSKPRHAIAVLVIFALLAISASGQTKNAEIERRIDALLAKMTVAEKLGQLQQLDGEANGRYRPEHLKMAENCML
ncbi:hypothetical protein OFB80_35535, partial [Escherichia coli]|nr:hypothetical protein [Escherichia coli]